MTWRRIVEPFLRPLMFAGFRLTRGLTLGVRGIVTNDQGEVLLVEHTYLPGWHLPGGGVERRETAELALVREMREEAGVRVLGRPVLLSIHSNEPNHRGDHVLLYRVQAWEPCAPAAQGEIHEIGWFAPDALPETTTAATRRRIAEALSGEQSDPMW